jgi:hypothetical protein
MCKNKLLYLIAVIIASVFVLVGCVADIDGKHEGLSIGFNYEHPKTLQPIIVAVRSDKIEFNISEVMLDFYIGWHDNPPNIVEQSDEIDTGYVYTVGFALYLIDEAIPIIEPQADYRNVESLYYMMEISAKTFVSEEYKMTMTKQNGKLFQQGESLAIPQELFLTQTQGESILFCVMEVSYSLDDELYHLYPISDIHNRISFELVSVNTVRLSKY